MSIQDTFNQCAKILGVKPEAFTTIFPDDDTTKLMVSNMSLDELTALLSAEFNNPKYNVVNFFDTERARIQIKVVAGIIMKNLKEEESPIKPQTQNSNTGTEVLIKLVNDIRPLANWSDRELLQAYIESPSEDIEAQLIVRSKGRRFVITNPPGSDVIDIEQSLNMLKRARKEEIPEFYRTADGSVVYIYRINELNRKSRTRHVCPVCNGILFEDHCGHCDIHFGDIGTRERQFISFALSRSSNTNISPLIDAAKKGIAVLSQTYPALAKRFLEAEVDETLPKLIKVERPTSGTSYGDPFKVRG